MPLQIYVIVLMAKAPREFAVTAPKALEEIGHEWAGWELSNAMFSNLSQRVNRPPQPRRQKREAHNALERWLLTAANNNPPRQEENVKWVVHRDLAAEGFGKFKAELSELGLATGPEEAHRWAAALIDLVETTMRAPIPLLASLVVMVDPSLPGVRARTAAGGKFYYRMRDPWILMKRAKKTLKDDVAAAAALARVSLRYAATLPGAQHWGLPLRFAREQYEAGVRYEGFASPFNSRMVLLGEKDTWFCSLFADTDFPFGSIGTFFGAPLAELGGKWTVNPPYVESVMERMAAKSEMEAARAASAGAPLVIHFLLPHWEDSAAIQAVTASEHAVLSETLPPSEHCLESPEGKEFDPNFGNLFVVWEVPLPDAAGRRAAARLAAGARGPCSSAGEEPSRRPPRRGRRGGGESPRPNRNNTSFPVQVAAQLRALHATYLGLRDRTGEAPSQDELAAAALRYYQYLVRTVMSAQDSWMGAPGAGGARGLLVYHEMGMGKTLLAAATAVALWDARPPLVIVAKSLQKNFTSTVAKYVAVLHPELGGAALADAQAAAVARFRLVSLDANNMATLVARATEGAEGAGSLDGRLLIIDEAHNLFRAIINSPNEKTNARRLFDMVMEARNLRILFLSGTPVSKDPFELVPCYNMLAGYDLLPSQYEVFYRLYVDVGARGVRNRAKLANRLVGLTSFASHPCQAGTPAGVANRARELGGFPEELALVVEQLEMGPEQYRQYLLAREKEEAEGRTGDRAPAARERVSNSPPLALPSSEAGGGSTYYVRSRMLSNFGPPAPRVAGRTAGEPVEPDRMPDSAFGPEASPKATRLLANLAKARGPALIYSQFVHGGGLAVIARYLRLAGYAEFPSPAAGGRERRRPRPAAEGWGPPCWGEAGAQAALAAARAAQIPVTREGAIARMVEPPPRRPSRWVDLEADRAGVAYHYRGSHGAEAEGPRLDSLMNLHRGQRKLFISELLGLTHFLPRADAEVAVVYAGAARGDHLVFLADLFPGATFHLYDPNPFDARLSEAPDRFRVHNGLFTDEIAQGWGGGRCGVFISDIRSVTRDMSGGEAAFEARVRADMEAQTAWARLIAPRLGCILKFRPPYVDPEKEARPEQDTFECLRGRAMWQAWPPKLSTEGRLIVEAADAAPGAPPMQLDARLYQDVCFHHNTIARPWGSFAWGRHQAPSGFGAATSAMRRLVPGYDGCFDCALEARAWADFLALPGATTPPAEPPTTAQVGAMMTRLSRELRKGLRHWEKPPYHGYFAGCPADRIRRALAAQKQKPPASGGASDAPSPRGSSAASGPEGTDGASDAESGPEEEPGAGAPHYAIISGDIPVEDRARIQEAFNSPQNAHGGVIRALLVSKTGAEGLDLKGVRQVHIFEPYWDKAREDQVKARGIRIGSHDHLSAEEREVQPFLYISVPNRAMQESMRPTRAEEGAPPAQKYRPVEVRTIDEEFHARATRRYELNGAFRGLLREVSIECALSGVANCRLCVPTDALLFHEDPMHDLRLPDPCLPLAEAEVQALETELDGVRYFYQRDASSPLGFRFFVYDDSMDAHVPVDPSTGLFRRLMDQVEGK